MRTLFIPLAKLFGLYAVFRPLFYIANLVYMFFIRSDIKQGSFRSVFIVSCMHAAGLLLAFLLIFKTDKVADILKLPEDRTDSIVINSGSILRTGLILIGVAILVFYIPALISLIIFIIGEERKIAWAVQERVWRCIVEIVFGCLLLFLATPLARFLNKEEEEDDNSMLYR